MNTNTDFVKKRLANLPMKYVRKSIHNFLHNGNGRIYLDDLEEIDKQYFEFIEMPKKPITK